MPPALTDDEPLATCAGLTAEQLVCRPVPPSTLSLLGLVRHLTKVERLWFRQRAGDEPVPPLYVRLVHLHVVTEYAQHNGHADLLRQAIDGTTRS